MLLMAQGRYPFSQYKKGISQIQITCIKEDKKTGNIWVGTKEGINIFYPNEARFENSTDNPTLQNTYIVDIEVDKKGLMWYKTLEGFFCEDGKAYKIEAGYARFTFNAENELVFLKSKNDENRPFMLKKGKEYPIPTLPDKVHGDILWHEASQSVVFADQQKGRAYFLTVNGDTSSIAIQKQPFSFVEASNGKMYAYTRHTVFEVSNKKLTLFFEIPRQDSNYISINIDAAKNLYFFNQQQHLIKYDSLKRRTDFGTDFILPKTIEITHNHKLFCSSEEGLIKYSSEAFTYYGEKEGVINPWAVVTENDGTLWYASFGVGLYRYDNYKEKFVQKTDYQKLDKSMFPTDKSFYFGAIRDHFGNLLFPYSQWGLLKYEGNNSPIFLHKKIKTIGNLLSMAILDDALHERYVLGTQGRITTIDYKGNLTSYSDSTQINRHAYIRAIAQTKKGDIYIGGYKGWGFWDEDNNKIKKINTSERQYVGLALYSDYKDNIWAAEGIGAGIALYDTQKRILNRVLIGSLKATVQAINAIDSSYLLIAAGDGLYILDLQAFYKSGQEYLVKFDDDNGAIIGSECGQNGIHKANDSLFYFTTNDAIMRLDAARFKREAKRVDWGVETIRISGTKDTLNRSIFAKNVFYHFDNALELIFKKNENMDYTIRYELKYLEKGMDSLCKSGISYHTLLLDNLPTGKYRLTVYPEFSYEGLLNTKSFIIEFEILPPWHYYRLLTIGLIIAIVILILIVWNQLLRRGKQLSEREKERAQIQSRIKEFQLQNIRTQIEPHFFFNSLACIQGLIVKNDEVGISIIMRDIRKMMAMLLRTSSIFWTLKDEIEFVIAYLNIEGVTYKGKFSYDINENIGNIAKENIIVPKTMVQGVINNSMKYAIEERKYGGGEIQIVVNSIENGIQFVITDNGTGFSKVSDDNQKEGTGNKRIKSIFAILNESTPIIPFSFNTGNVIKNGEVKGAFVEIIIPLHFNTYEDAKHPET